MQFRCQLCEGEVTCVGFGHPLSFCEHLPSMQIDEMEKQITINCIQL